MELSLSKSEVSPSEEEHLANIERIRSTYECDEDGYVSFDRSVEGEFGLMGQYAAAFIDGFNGTPVIADDLVVGDPRNWYSLKITPENLVVFGERHKAYRAAEIAKMIARLSANR